MIDHLVECRTDGSSISQRVLQNALDVAESRCGDTHSGVYGLIKLCSVGYFAFLLIWVIMYKSLAKPARTLSAIHHL